MKWYIMVLKKYAVFTGRATRQEFWMYTLFSIIFSIVAQILDKILGFTSPGNYMNIGWISLFYSLAVFVPGLAVTVRRFHDIGKSGWVYARFLIALMFMVFALVGYIVYFLVRNGGMDAIQNGEINPAILTGTFILAVLVIFLLMLILSIWLLVLLCRETQPHENRWGRNPLAVELPGDSEIFGDRM